MTASCCFTTNIELMETDLKHLDPKTERKTRPVYSPEHVITLHDPRPRTERRQVTCLLLAVDLLLLLLPQRLRYLWIHLR